MLEKNLQKNILKICKEYNILTRKLNAESQRGWPDLILLLPNGTVIFLEVKTKTGKLSKLQEYTIQEIKERKGNVHVVRSTEEVKTIIESHSHPKTINPC